MRFPPFRGLIEFALLLLLVQSAAAQGVGSEHIPSTSRIQFIPRYSFHLSAEHLSGADKRFVWDTNFGGEIDFMDYEKGRLTFEANYEAVLGDELRAFDPNQGNYVLSPRLSLRVKGVEAAAVFYHQSRHYSDRSKLLPVDWNMVGGRVSKTFERHGNTVETHLDLRKMVARTSVDYRWELEGSARSVVPLRHGVGLVAGAAVRILGVDGSQNRGTQHGYNAEGGIRFGGEAGAIELYVSGERRIDPYPLEFSTAKWFGLGFRFLSN